MAWPELYAKFLQIKPFDDQIPWVRGLIGISFNKKTPVLVCRIQKSTVKHGLPVFRGVVNILTHWAYVETDEYPIPMEVLVFEISSVEINSILPPMTL